MVSGDRLTLEEVLAAFDEYLRRTRGACAGTRRNYARFVRAFLQTVSGDGPVRVALIHPRGTLVRGCRPAVLCEAEPPGAASVLVAVT